MTIPGKVIKTTGKVFGNTMEYGIWFAGELIGYIAESKGKHKAARRSRAIGKFTGRAAGGITRLVSSALGNAVDKAVEVGLEGARYAAENAVKTETRIYGEADEFFEKSCFVEAEYKVE